MHLAKTFIQRDLSIHQLSYPLHRGQFPQEQLRVKCLAQGHKSGSLDSNPQFKGH